MWLHSSVGRASHRYRRGHRFESHWSPDFFQASSFQLLKLENLLRWSFSTFTWKIAQGQNGDNIIHTWIIFFLGGADWHQLIHTGKLYFCPLPKQNKVNEQSFRPKTPLLKVIKKIQLVLNVNLMYWLLSSGPKVTRSDAACLSFKSKARSSFLVPKSRKQRSNLQC